ncbi:MAG: NUDIX hydrolase [Anaerolineales bacterium]|nr:NUDIX hydrolase [Anaerolineales bacterium]
MVKPWETRERQEIGNFKIFTLRQDLCRAPRTGQDHLFYVLAAPDWINVIALTPAGQVVLIHQYRHGTEEVTLEIPGGMVDPEDGDPAEAARRELLEETGYAAAELRHIGSVTPNPAFLDNRCHTYLALDARPVQAPQFDGREEIAVELVELAAVPGLIADGRISHALVIAGFYHLENYRRHSARPF